jgi:hypothetical protein
MITLTNCTECNMPGGTVPHYYEGNVWMEDVKEMLHEDCALLRINRYLDRKAKELESESP